MAKKIKNIDWSIWGNTTGIIGFTETGSAITEDRNGIFISKHPSSLGRMISRKQFETMRLFDPDN